MYSQYKDHDRTYVKIHLDYFKHNIEEIKRHLGPKHHILVVIKTDGYGHGAVRLAKELENDDFVWGYAAATLEEAVELREAGISKKILILGYTFPSAYEEMVRYNITPAIFDLESAIGFAKESKKQGKDSPIHLKVDTGMSRIGMPVTSESISLVENISKLNGITLEGIFTHLARADERDPSFTHHQIEQFMIFCHKLKETGIDIPIRHCANSAGIMEFPESQLELMRAGIIVYGLWPSNEVHKTYLDLKPVLEWKSSVAYVKTIEANVPVSYGGTFITQRETKVATIPVGYGDGYPRSLSNTGYVLIRGRRAPIIGRVCMDQFMVDVTDIEGVKRSDSVTLIGRDGAESISADEFAEWNHTINYEIICNISKRVPRIYVTDAD